MATEQDKLAHRLRLWALTAMGMGIGVWDMVQESAVSLSPTIGSATLTELEKQLGLEIAGEKPEDILTELGRIFVDEYGYASEAKVERTGNSLRVTLCNAVGMPEFTNVQARGVEKMFFHPYFCTGLAALSRLGLKARGTVEINNAAKSQIVTFELL
jgi:hypothetical protein